MGAENATEAQASSLLEDDDVATIWKRFRSGEVIFCARDGAQVALNVDGSQRTYRFVCVDCGRSSSWFEDSLGGVFRLRTTTVPHALDDQDGDHDADHDQD